MFSAPDKLFTVKGTEKAVPGPMHWKVDEMVWGIFSVTPAFLCDLAWDSLSLLLFQCPGCKTGMQ